MVSDSPQAQRAPKPTRWSPIEECRSSKLPYERFLADYVGRNRPLVIRGAVDAWPALRKWTPAFFRENFASKMVLVSYSEQLSFSDFIDGVLKSTEEAPGPYMYRLFLHEHLPEVLPDLIPQNRYAFPRRYSSPLMPTYWRRPDGYLKLLIGGVGGRFPVMHFDTEHVHATVTEIYGDKEFLMYAPEDSSYLYPNPEAPNHSMIKDPQHQDLEQFPLMSKASQFRAVLKPGDMVFVPCGWWHTARALSPSISVGTNMLDVSNWKGFVAEVCNSGKSAPKRVLKKAYFSALGAVLWGLERLQEVQPGLAASLRFPRRLAPLSSAVAKDPSLAPLRIRIPTG